MVAVKGLGRIAGLAAAVSTVGLVVLVGTVGAVAVVAEFQGTWVWFRRMELAVTATAEPAVALATVATLAALVAVACVE